MITVVAGIVWKEDKILLARRNPLKYLAGKWEFPGGKVESGETPEMALERELREEFNIATKTKGYLDTNVHAYPILTIKLIAYHSHYISGSLTLTDHDRVEWVRVGDLISYDFAEADIPFVRKLVSQFARAANC